MGVQPHHYLLNIQEQMTKARRSPPFSKHSLRWHRHHEPNSEETEHLKERLLRIHKMKLTHFRLSHMKKVVEPSVHVVVLPEEAQKLKEKILRSHKAKPTRFSLSHMKTVVVPPVDIPREMNCQRALTMIVAGRNVPLTRTMWDNTKRKVHYMEQIPESYPLDCTLFR
ncbi:unnamed protein product [Peronospora farinosa]|uniref:Uncharacterized protein n=1 Tax=Peronospora farinosa TaxID=134698 RepID=A0AAV0TW70_9STRA|nr:unnamed protein product [Peronospora farinosa]CAI5728544.1 unnamed protein product [Peronospora farinosa]